MGNKFRNILLVGLGIVVGVVASIQFSAMKVIFDVTLVCISIVTGLVFLGRLEGVREGTVAAAICVGLLAKWFNKPLAKFEQAVLCRR